MGTSPIEADPAALSKRLLDQLQRLPESRRFWVAFSGGVDSHVLLHALAAVRGRLPGELAAVHVNHGLQPDANFWEAHCRGVCRGLAVPLEIRRLAMKVGAGQSLEAAAREARYAVLRRLVRAGETLLTAHNRDDQAETVLLQLIRGAGPSGLAAMPFIAPFDHAWLARPMLETTRRDVEAYARVQGLEWVEDPSNRATGIDRNFLRREVMPRLFTRWPSVSATIARSARHCAEAQGLIDELAAADISGLVDSEDGSIDADGLLALPPPRARAVLRVWIRRAGHRLPDTARLDRAMSEVLNARSDRNPVVGWPGTELRRYRGRLHLMQPLPENAAGWSADWTGEGVVRLPGGGSLQAGRGGGIDPERWRAARKRVAFRSGGERLKPAGRGVTVSFKNFCQERGIPPWQRPRIPLLYLDDQLAAVADLCVCEGFQAPPGGDGVRLRWER